MQVFCKRVCTDEDMHMLTNVGARVSESDLKVGLVVMRACVYVIVHVYKCTYTYIYICIYIYVCIYV